MTASTEASSALAVGVLFLILGAAYADAMRSPENQHGPGRFMAWWTQVAFRMEGRTLAIYIRTSAVAFLIGGVAFLARAAAILTK